MSSLEGFGNRLRVAREGLGVPLDWLVDETRCSLRYLEALEEGRVESLPGGIFRHGILRAYLNALKLNEHEWLASFDAALVGSAGLANVQGKQQEDTWFTFASNIKRGRTQSRNGTGWRWLGVLLLTFLLVCGAWLVWMLQLKALMEKH